MSLIREVVRFAAVLACTLVVADIAGADEPAGTARQILNDLGKRAFRWFEDNRNPKSGLIRDRAPNWKGRGTLSNMASIASSGYYLSMLPEAVCLGQISRADAEAHSLRMLRFITEKMHHEHGLLYHFIDWETGQRWDRCEISALDSAIFLNGCMVVAEAFGGQIAELANHLLDRVDWTKYLTEHPQAKRSVLSLGWKPESGLVGATDYRSSEMAMPYFLAIGSTTHPIDPECWYNTPVRYGTVCGYKILNPVHPLFTFYYGLGWHDLKGKVDRTSVDLEANARLAALANREFCRALAGKFRSFRESEGSWWGISAGDSPKGYIAPGPVTADQDGTVWTTAALAALPWIPRELNEDVRRWRASKTWRRISGEYGLSPFNLDKDWIGDDVIGIDLGSFYINLANYRNRTIWSLWMRHPVAKNALKRLRFSERGT